MSDQDQVDDLTEAFGDLTERVAVAVGYEPIRSLEEFVELLALKTEDPFLARAYIVAPRGAAKAPAIAEANMDAVRLWVVPMPKGKRYSAVCLWKSAGDGDKPGRPTA